MNLIEFNCGADHCCKVQPTWYNHKCPECYFYGKCKSYLKDTYETYQVTKKKKEIIEALLGRPLQYQYVSEDELYEINKKNKKNRPPTNISTNSIDKLRCIEGVGTTFINQLKMIGINTMGDIITEKDNLYKKFEALKIEGRISYQISNKFLVKLITDTERMLVKI